MSDQAAKGKAVVPTRVGVNRFARGAASPYLCRPRTRGGEPLSPAYFAPFTFVVPTRVGVNRDGKAERKSASGRPHTRGGEPTPQQARKLLYESSPHAWG